jgi:Ca2+-binding RTX toxin-like protein
VGGAGNDTLSGLGGNDTLGGSGGNDVYDGGTNFDLLSFVGATSGVTVGFAATGTISGAYSGTFTNIEGVRGGDFADTLLGGGAGQNFSGRGGNDTIAGGGGIDTLYGGGGADDFVFREMGTTNADRVQDFVIGSDDIALDNAAFTAIGALGDFAAGDGRFRSGAGLTSGQDASDRVIYNTTNGNLYYDADGSGAGAAQLVATLTGVPLLAATDITVI